MKLTQKILKKYLKYDHKTGIFTRVCSPYGPADSRFSGKPAGWVSRGYIQIHVHKSSYRAHRLAWLYMTGTWPENDIDHINGIRSDNRWKNLRKCDRSFNMENQRNARSNNTTGYLGVYRARNKYMASITIRGKRKKLGLFCTPEEAHKAYLKAKRKYHEGCTI